MANPIPYRGSEPYIFISYAHKDAQLVLPIVEQMQRDGYRVWYDEGIDPGTEWDEFIASHVVGCGFFIAFMSRNYLLSENCKDELNFARDLKKPQVLVYLERVKLPRGIELRVGRCAHFNADLNGNFLRKLYQADGIAPFCEAPAKKKLKPFWLIPVVLAAAFGIGAALAGHSANPPDPTDPPAETTTVPAETTLPMIAGTVICDEALGKATIQEVSCDDDGALHVRMYLENKTDQELTFFIHNWMINRFIVPDSDSFQTALSPNESREETMVWSRDTLRSYGIGGITQESDVKTLKGRLVVRTETEDYGTDFTYYPHGEEHAEIQAYRIHENDQVLMDTGAYQVVLRNSQYDSDGNWVLDYVAINNLVVPVSMSFTVTGINGYITHFINDNQLEPNSWFQNRIVISNWQYTDQDAIRQAKIQMYFWAEGTGTPTQETAILYPEDDTDFAAPVRQLQESDLILLDNEYVRVAAVEAVNDNNFHRFHIYVQNKVPNKQMYIAAADEANSIFLVNDYMEPFEQTVGSFGVYVPPGEEVPKFSFHLKVYNRTSDRTPVFSQQITFDPSQMEYTQ